MANDIVNELRELARAWNEELVDNPLFTRAASRIERLENRNIRLSDMLSRMRSAGDDLAAVLRSGSDCGWDAAIDNWNNLIGEFDNE